MAYRIVCNGVLHHLQWLAATTAVVAVRHCSGCSTPLQWLEKSSIRWLKESIRLHVVPHDAM